MAFTFTVEDGTIVAGANSYLSLADAAAILEVDFRLFPIWTALPDDETKQKALVMATMYLEDNWHWFGKRTGPLQTPPVSQPLKWPRTYMRDCEGNDIAINVIPSELKRAVAQLAIWLRENDGNEKLDSEGIKRFRSDELEIEWQDGYAGRVAPEFASKLLKCFGYGPNDRGFKPIVRV